MKIRTELRAGGKSLNHNQTLAVRSALKAGRMGWSNHNETLAVRTTLKAGRRGADVNHNETLAVRTTLKAGRRGQDLNHNEALQTRTGLKAGKVRRVVQVTARKEDRLELLVVRAGLRAGARSRKVYR